MQGKIINGFVLQRLLGMGGMAEVWYAENEIHKPAAVKLLNEELSHNTNIVDRFRSEAEIMVKLNHPNIREVYGYGSIDGRPAIIMEYLEGDDLKARMKRGQRFTDDELQKWWNQLVSALNYTHQKGIVHRDIKPGNIFVDTEGNIKLLDFGIAKVRESISATQTGQKLGTLMYMSPEQVRDSKHIDYRTDVYSLAVTFVHLLTGKKPYDSNTTSDYDIMTNIVTKPLDLNGVPSEWQGFLIPYLEKEPTQRPALRLFEPVLIVKPTIMDNDEGTMVGDEIQPQPYVAPVQVFTGGVTPPPTTPPVVPLPAKSKGGKGIWAFIGVVLLALLGALLFTVLKPDPDMEAFKACQTVNDYRGYITSFGHNAEHFAEAKQIIDKHVADSTAEAQRIIAEKQENSTTNGYIETAFGINMKMVWVEGGDFVMGCTSSNNDDCKNDFYEANVREVTVDGFYIGVFEVTQSQWEKVMGTSPSCFKGDDKPVESIDWVDAMDFCRLLSVKTGKNYTLPTEAQWEYAARGGIAKDGTKYSGSNDLNEVAWYSGNDNRITHSCGTKKPNGLGIYDMSGNVWEWCRDWFSFSYDSSDTHNPLGPSSGTRRVMRGSSWYCPEGGARVWYHGGFEPDYRRNDLGFRIVCIPNNR